MTKLEHIQQLERYAKLCEEQATQPAPIEILASILCAFFTGATVMLTVTLWMLGA